MILSVTVINCLRWQALHPASMMLRAQQSASNSCESTGINKAQAAHLGIASHLEQYHL